ncbi:MAG: hypothetical protein Q4F38_05730 [Akkermansia sp.]|nr:hypothetical protein [Akkermansia sp.]
MKSAIYKALLIGGVFAPSVYGLSLYDTSPMIGVPESYAIRYRAYVNVGYDDNVHSSPNAESGAFVKFGVGASYADYESVSKLSYNVQLGAQIYDKGSHGTNDQMFSDASLNATYSRSLGAASSYTLSMHVSYRPDPDYSHAFTGAYAHGDCLNWHIRNTYSEGIDERWSWNASVGFSGSMYTDSAYSYDDRYYATLSMGLAYVADERTTYGVNLSYRYDFRDEGANSENVYLNGYVRHTLSPVSSCYLAVGVQAKTMGGSTDMYPTLSASYRRTLSEGLSVEAYTSYDNENVNSYYKPTRANYRSVATWRIGTRFNYAFTPTVSFQWGASLVQTNYSKGTHGLASSDRTLWSAYVGMRYVFTESLVGNVQYTYTSSDSSYSYDRNVISAGLEYNF